MKLTGVEIANYRVPWRPIQARLERHRFLLDPLLKIRESTHVHWNGKHRELGRWLVDFNRQEWVLCNQALEPLCVPPQHIVEFGQNRP